MPRTFAAGFGLPAIIELMRPFVAARCHACDSLSFQLSMAALFGTSRQGSYSSSR
jgi:hypothetical protein